MTRSRSVLFAIAVTVVLGLLTGVSTEARAADGGQAKSELTIGPKTFLLQHAYALSIDDVEGIRFQGEPQKIILLLFTDAAIPAGDVGKFFRCASLARSGKLNGVEIRFDAATKKMFGGAIYHGMGPSQPATVSMTVSGDSSTYEFKDLQLGPDICSGRAEMTNAEPFPSLDPKATPLTFQFDVSFRTPLALQPAVTSDLKGAQAQKSAPVQAMLSFQAACRRGDVQGARRLAVPEATEEWDAIIAKVGAKRFGKMMQSYAPKMEAQDKQITRVVVRGDRATILSKEPGGQGNQPMVKKNGVWLLDAS